MYKLLIDANILKRAVEQLGHSIVGYIAYGRVEGALELGEYGFYLPENHLVLILSQWHDSAFANGELFIGNHLVEVNLIDNTKTFTMRTSALRRIERKIVWRRVGVTYARGWTHQSLREMFKLTGILVENHD